MGNKFCKYIPIPYICTRKASGTNHVNQRNQTRSSSEAVKFLRRQRKLFEGLTDEEKEKTLENFKKRRLPGQTLRLPRKQSPPDPTLHKSPGRSPSSARQTSKRTSLNTHGRPLSQRKRKLSRHHPNHEGKK